MTTYYTETHEWVREVDGMLYVGITSYAAEQLGDLVYIDFADVGSSFDKGDYCAVVESVKAASDIYCPVKGSITKINEELVDAPELINDDATTWMFIIKPTSDIILSENFMNEDEYNKLLEECE